MASVSAPGLDLVWSRELEPDLREFQVQVANETLAEEIAQGFDSRPRRIVDRRFDAPITSVKFGGRIEFLASFDLAEIAEWVWMEVRRRSPILSGDYQDSHVIMVNGTSRAVLGELQPTDRVQIVNTRPYARKIEGGGGPSGPTKAPQSLQAPNGVYRMVYRAARSRFGRNAFIDWKWVKLDLGVRAWGLQGGRSKGVVHDRARKRILRPMVYPAIQIYQQQLQ